MSKRFYELRIGIALEEPDEVEGLSLRWLVEDAIAETLDEQKGINVLESDWSEFGTWKELIGEVKQMNHPSNGAGMDQHRENIATRLELAGYLNHTTDDEAEIE
jgi:hypothetical protein